MRLTDSDLEFLFRELSAWHEAASVDPEFAGVERIATMDRLLDKIADKQIRRQGKHEALPGKTHPSKWDRFRPESAMDLLMKKINTDCSA